MRHHIPLHLRWSDLDAYNHVNNARLLSLLEESRVRTFWPSTDDEPGPLAVVDGRQGGATLTLIARQEIEYLAPIPYQRRPIDVQLWIARLGAASSEVHYEVWSPESDDPEARVRYAVAASTIVFVDADTGRPRRITDTERAAWTPYLDEPARFRGGNGSPS